MYIKHIYFVEDIVEHLKIRFEGNFLGRAGQPVRSHSSTPCWVPLLQHYRHAAPAWPVLWVQPGVISESLHQTPGRAVHTETFTNREGKCASAYLLCIFLPFPNISFAFNLYMSNDSKLQMY